MMLLALLVAALTPYVSRAVPARCLLEVNERTIFAGICDFERFDADGSFTITERSRRGVKPYFAYLVRYVDHTADGSWNGSRDSTHAQDTLGEMTQHGACWVNVTPGYSGAAPGRNRICAWKMN